MKKIYFVGYVDTKAADCDDVNYLVGSIVVAADSKEQSIECCKQYLISEYYSQKTIDSLTFDSEELKSIKDINSNNYKLSITIQR